MENVKAIFSTLIFLCIDENKIVHSHFQMYNILLLYYQHIILYDI
jgi:hypothetical protein